MTKNKVFNTDEKTLYSSCRDKSSTSGKKSVEMSKHLSKSSKSTNCELFSSSFGSDLNNTGQRVCGSHRQSGVPAWLYINAYGLTKADTKADGRARGSVTRPDVSAWLNIDAYRTMDAHGGVLSTLSVQSHGRENLKEAGIVKKQLEKYHVVHEKKANERKEPNTIKHQPREVNHG